MKAFLQESDVQTGNIAGELQGFTGNQKLVQLIKKSRPKSKAHDGHKMSGKKRTYVSLHGYQVCLRGRGRERGRGTFLPLPVVFSSFSPPPPLPHTHTLTLLKSLILRLDAVQEMLPLTSQCSLVTLLFLCLLALT